MRRTDFCHLTFLVRAPAPRRLSLRQTLARLRNEEIACFTFRAIRFGGSHVLLVGGVAVGVVFPP